MDNLDFNLKSLSLTYDNYPREPSEPSNASSRSRSSSAGPPSGASSSSGSPSGGSSSGRSSSRSSSGVSTERSTSSPNDLNAEALHPPIYPDPIFYIPPPNHAAIPPWEYQNHTAAVNNEPVAFPIFSHGVVINHPPAPNMHMAPFPFGFVQNPAPTPPPPVINIPPPQVMVANQPPPPQANQSPPIPFVAYPQGFVPNHPPPPQVNHNHPVGMVTVPIGNLANFPVNHSPPVRMVTVPIGNLANFPLAPQANHNAPVANHSAPMRMMAAIPIAVVAPQVNHNAPRQMLGVPRTFAANHPPTSQVNHSAPMQMVAAVPIAVVAPQPIAPPINAASQQAFVYQPPTSVHNPPTHPPMYYLPRIPVQGGFLAPGALFHYQAPPVAPCNQNGNAVLRPRIFP